MAISDSFGRKHRVKPQNAAQARGVTRHLRAVEPGHHRRRRGAALAGDGFIVGLFLVCAHFARRKQLQPHLDGGPYSSCVQSNSGPLASGSTNGPWLAQSEPPSDRSVPTLGLRVRPSCTARALGTFPARLTRVNKGKPHSHADLNGPCRTRTYDHGIKRSVRRVPLSTSLSRNPRNRGCSTRNDRGRSTADCRGLLTTC